MKSSVMAFTGVAALLLSTSANAQYGGSESPRSGAFQLQLSNYQPDIDGEFELAAGDKGPYAEVFGGEEVMVSVLWDRHVYQGVGTASLGLGLGYWSVEGTGISSGLTEDSTSFEIFPVLAQATYRFDLFQDTIPLVPVIRLGVDYYMWRIEDGAGDTAQMLACARNESGERTCTGDKDAAGGTWGWHYSLGVHILLDYFSEGMAADFDRDAGVNNSYITLEYHRSTVDDFGSDTSFHLGDDTFFIGLGLDF